MLESEMSAQEKTVTEKVTLHMQEQYKQEFEKIAQQYKSDMLALQQAHEAEMTAAHAREEENLLKVTAILLLLL
jgi:hypothetical protein